MTNMNAEPATQAIAEALRDSGRTTRWLARKLAIDETILYHAFAGRRRLNVARIEAAADLLGIPRSAIARLYEDRKAS